MSDISKTAEKIEDAEKSPVLMPDAREVNPTAGKGPDELYKELIERIRKYHPSADISLIEKAYRAAREAHGEQVRKSGEPYIIHPLSVALILADLEMDKETIAAALLHDAVEDTGVTSEDVRRDFGSEVELLVDGVTKLGQIDYSMDKMERQAENLRKMFLAMAKDIRVILIKLADRLHNMRTLQYMPRHKQIEKARETMDIYSPIAMRLGISKIKIELDDLALRYTQPEVFEKLVKDIAGTSKERQNFVDLIVKDVSHHMETANIKATVYGRVKHYFSIYKKMVNQDKTIDQIYDLFAVRIIVDSVLDCYAALGIIHEMYKPIPGRFKDYIAMPKANMYQSLHTTLIGPGGRPFEIQIRTAEMHRTAEYGIAAHWKYKEMSDGQVSKGDSAEAKLTWLRQILEWQRDMTDNHEFMSLLKSDLDLFAENVYCFSPAGDVKSLPSGACTIDFAYAVHSAVGNKMVGARVNGKLVPIETVLHNGDRVEIITSQNAKGPSRDWLKVVKSTQAKNKINQWFKKELKEENIEKGRDLLLQYAKVKGQPLSVLLKNKYMEAVQRKYGFQDWNAVMAALGHGSLKEGQVYNKLNDLYIKDHQEQITDAEILQSTNKPKAVITHKKNHNGIVVKGIHDMAVRFSKCCSPLPGDEIVGYITRGRGITIHRTDCVNVLGMSREDRARLIEAEWEIDPNEQLKEGYQVELSVYANNRTGLVVDISRIFTEKKIDITSMSSRISKQGIATIELAFDIHCIADLDNLIREIKLIDSVVEVERKRG